MTVVMNETWQKLHWVTSEAKSDRECSWPVASLGHLLWEPSATMEEVWPF